MLFLGDEHVCEGFPLYRQNIDPGHAFASGCVADNVDQAVNRALRGKGRPIEEEAGTEESEPVET